VSNSPDSCAGTQRDLTRLEKWTDRDLMKFNKESCSLAPEEE